MTTILKYFIVLAFLSLTANAQEVKTAEQKLADNKKTIVLQEKEALKKAVVRIDEKVKKGELTEEEGEVAKKEAAELHALNIEDRIVILDNSYALKQRNGGEVLALDTISDVSAIEINWGAEDRDGDRLFGVNYKSKQDSIKPKYDVRTYSDLVFAFGLNNAIIDGSLDDSPYQIGGSRFFELGWQWRTRLFKETNFWRLNYGVSFQFNGLKPTDNRYFELDNDNQVVLAEFNEPLKKAKLRMDNLVIPLHLEFGPSKFTQSEDKIRYSIHKKMRFGIGGYGGVNLGTRQKLKYTLGGENVKDKIKRSYNTSNLIYGLSGYVGVGDVQLYVKYDLNPIFKDAAIDQHNVSVGLRFDM